MICGKCGMRASVYDLFDYCLKCSKNLCASCMDNGCCGEVPAKSGMDADYKEAWNREINS